LLDSPHDEARIDLGRLLLVVCVIGLATAGAYFLVKEKESQQNEGTKTEEAVEHQTATYIVLSSCLKNMACVQICPVDCFYDAGNTLVINPNECIECGACIPECPTESILPENEVPEEKQASIEKNRNFFADKSVDDLKRLRQMPR